MKQITQNYLKLLPFLGMFANEEGQIFLGHKDIKLEDPIQVEGKNLYLPTQEFLKSADKSKVGFHPLCESVVMTPSPVLKMIQDSMNHRLNSVAMFFIQTLISASIAQKKNTLKSKDPNLMNILVGNEDCTADTQNFFNAIMNSIIESEDGNKIIRVYFKSGGEIRDEKYSRICSISSPLLEQLERPGAREVFGVTPKRKKDIAVLTHVLKTAFPGLDTKSYTRGSNDLNVPYFDALLKSLQVLTEDINRVARDLSEVEPCHSVLDYITTIQSDLDLFDDYEILRNQIPPLDCNSGGTFLTKTDNRRVELAERDHDKPLERSPNPTPVPQTPTYSIYDKPQVTHQEPAPVAPVSAQALARVPGTRQQIVQVDTSTDVVKNDYSSRRRHEDRGRNSNYGGGRSHRRDDDDDRGQRRGWSAPRREERRDDRDRPRASDFCDLRAVQDEIDYVRKKIKDLEYDRYYDDADDLKRGVLRDLYDIEADMKERDRYDDRNRRGYSSRPDRAGSRRDDRNRRERSRSSRNDRDRFGR